MVDALGAIIKKIGQRRLRRHPRQTRIVAHQIILTLSSREVRTCIGRAEFAVRHIEQRRFRKEYIELVAHFLFEGICALVQRYILSHGLILLIESTDYRAFSRLYSRTDARATQKFAKKRGVKYRRPFEISEIWKFPK